MTNQEIQDKIILMLQIPNICDMYEFGVSLNKDYVKSDFYKKTKLPLMDLAKIYQQREFTDLKKLFKKIQAEMNNLNFDKIIDLMSELNSKFTEQSINLKEEIKKLESLVK
jgi:hypothetical protein